MPKSRSRSSSRNRALARTRTAASPPSAPPERFVVGGTEVRPVELLRIPDRHPSGRGPWTGEPDRLSWTDAATGLACLVLRQANGVLAGYVAAAPGHPLWGFSHDAVPAALRIRAHRGLDYAAPCARRGSHDIRICHAHLDAARRAQREAPGRDAGADDAWWFGFCCDRPGDLVPMGPKPPLHREEGEVYRALDYVFHETVELARQLKAIEEEAASTDGTGRPDGSGGSGVPLQLGAPKAAETRTPRRSRSEDEA